VARFGIRGRDPAREQAVWLGGRFGVARRKGSQFLKAGAEFRNIAGKGEIFAAKSAMRRRSASPEQVSSARKSARADSSGFFKSTIPPASAPAPLRCISDSLRDSYGEARSKYIPQTGRANG
jgi:hypothetical protein